MKKMMKYKIAHLIWKYNEMYWPLRNKHLSNYSIFLPHYLYINLSVMQDFPGKTELTRMF